MSKFLAHNPTTGEYYECDTIEEARSACEECFLDDYENEYHPDTDQFRIYKLYESVEVEVVDSKDNYKYDYEDDIPEGDEESEAWPYDTDIDEIWKHKFVRDETTP